MFGEVVFGPVASRRLGTSLGINLLPTGSKLCNFNCVYCECGWNGRRETASPGFCRREDVSAGLRKAAVALRQKGTVIDTITFAGNGEPTMHPAFADIVKDTLQIRDLLFPASKVAVLTNATLLNRRNIVEALKSVDLRILKLDAGTEEMFAAINKPGSRRTLRWIADHLHYFNGDFIIQTMFIEGNVSGIDLNNTTSEHLSEWLRLVAELRPSQVMICSIDRATAAEGIKKVPKEKLDEIASMVNAMGIRAMVA